MRRTLPILVLAAGALALSACATTSHASETRPSAATAAAKQPADANAATTAERTTAAKPAVCDAFQLQATTVDTSAGAGSVTSELRITNLDVRNACRLPGRLRVTLDNNGQTVATAKAAKDSNTTVVLGAQKSVTAVLKTANGAGNLPAGQTCTRPGRIMITLPGHPRHATFPESTNTTLRSCGGLTLSTLTPAR